MKWMGLILYIIGPDNYIYVRLCNISAITVVSLQFWLKPFPYQRVYAHSLEPILLSLYCCRWEAVIRYIHTVWLRADDWPFLHPWIRIHWTDNQLATSFESISTFLLHEAMYLAQQAINGTHRSPPRMTDMPIALWDFQIFHHSKAVPGIQSLKKALSQCKFQLPITITDESIIAIVSIAAEHIPKFARPFICMRVNAGDEGNEYHHLMQNF